MSLKSRNDWLHKQSFSPGSIDEICQCGTEIAICASDDPGRFRAELLAYTFFDQFLFTYFREIHFAYKREFPGPKLRQHSFG